FPPTDRSDFTYEEFSDEPAHILSPPEYDCFYFKNLPDLGELISSLNSEIRKNFSSTTCVNLPVEDDYSPLLAYVVSPLIVLIRLSRVYLIGVELSWDSILILPGSRLLWGSSGEGSGSVMEVVEWPGKVGRWGSSGEGSGSVMEVVEWPGKVGRWGCEGWREKRVQVNSAY
nr:hypothetical protein [Tanacetum cinerariifolium]